MLQFIFGLPRSAKTTTILEKVENLNNENQKSVIIVPEQSTFETEKSVLKRIGDSFSKNVEVLSFSRLQEVISRDVGGVSSKLLKDSDKIIFMSRALKQIKSELKIWGKYANSLNFAKTMLDTIGEFKVCAVSSDEIKKAQSLITQSGLKDKLYDLTLIYETYDMLLGERFIDPVDKLEILYRQLEQNPYFSQKTVFIDGFKGFTGVQFKIIARILSQAKDTFISFTNDISSTKEFDIFTNIRQAVSRIEKLANARNVTVKKPLVLDKTFYYNQSIPKLERILSQNQVSGENDNSIVICKARSIYDEAEFAARKIRKLVREENYRYRDFIIIARDTDTYLQAVE